MDSAPTPLDFIGPKQIISSLDSNKVLDIERKKYVKGTKLILYQNYKQLNQKFFIEKVGLAEYIIRAAHSNLVLGVEGGYLDISEKPVNDYRRVVQLPQTNDISQKWIFEDAKDGYYFIRNTLGWYLDVYNSNTSNLTPINIHPFNGTKAQKFKII